MEGGLAVTTDPDGRGSDGAKPRTALEDAAAPPREIKELIYIMKAVESTSDAIGISDSLGRHFYQNKASSDLFGYATAEELEAAGGGKAVVNDPAVAKEMFDTIMSGKPWVGELEMVTKNGRVFPAFERADAIKDTGGNVIGLIGIITDITERKRTEEALRVSEDRYRDLVEHSQDLICTHDLKGRLLSVNPWAARILGYSQDELLAMDMREFIAPELRGHFDEYLEEIARSGAARGLLMIRTRSGERRVWEFNNTLRTKDVTEPVVRGMAQDITDRLRAEKALRDSETRYRSIFDSSADGIVIIDPDTAAPIDFNQQACAQLGYTREEFVRLKISDIDALEDHEEVKAHIQKVIDTGYDEFETHHRTKRGELRNVHVKAQYIKVGGKSVYNCIWRDVTERKREEEEKRNLERQLLQAQKRESLGVLAGGIAHDFNNLLTVVLGHAEMALGAIPPMSPARNSLTEISTAARRAADLSLQMLAYAGKVTFAVARVGLRELVEEMAHLLQSAISKKAILNLNLERGLPPIEADPIQIRQIVMNLIINASEAIGDRDGVITVSVGTTRCDEEYLRNTELHDGLAPGPYVHLEVTDTGHGMDGETRSRIFEPFFSTKFTGRGLGLAAVLGIVRTHNGTLKVDSDPGKGTTFKVLFPALEDAVEAGARPNKPSPPADWRGTGTILLVDDEESLLALGSRMLEVLGFTVLTAADGLQAVELYRDRGKEIDLVLMDLTMPHLDGSEAFGELRRLNPDVRVVLASGYDREDVASRFAEKGLAGIIQKPYTLAGMRKALAGLMRKRPDGEG